MGQNLRLNCTAHLMQRLLLTAFFILAVSALAVGISQGERYLQAFALALLGLFLYTALCVPAAKRLEHLGPLRLWLLLTILCVAIKVFWFWRVRVPRAGDYSVFWGYANALSERTTVYGGRYMALFPHIFGYADFLSWFIRLSGPQPMLAPVLNVLLTVCSGGQEAALCYCPSRGSALGEPAQVTIRIRSAKDAAPKADDAELETYKNIPNDGRLTGSDPEDTNLTFQLAEEPKRGKVELQENGSFVYTPAKNKVGEDSFTFTVTEAAGNVSHPATVRSSVKKPSECSAFADLTGSLDQVEAMWTAAAGLTGGRSIGGTQC